MRVIAGHTKGLLIGTLSREDSAVWAGPKTPDGRDLDEVRKRNRQEMRRKLRARSCAEGHIMASERHGGCMLDIIEID